MSTSIPARRAVAMLLALAAMLLGLTLISQATALSPARAVGNVVFDSVPASLASNYPSQGFEATQTNEMGEQVLLAGTDRVLDEVTATYSSWACVTGAWQFSNCETPPGATFDHDLTVNVYAVGAGDTLGALLATKTESVAVPYRPTASPQCIGQSAPVNYVGGWWDGTQCNNGIAFTHTFSLTSLGVTLPNQVIVTTSYNTNTSGYDPIGVAGPYDSLNVAAPGSTPTVGTDVDPDVIWVSTAGSDDELVTEDEWEGYNLAFRVTAHTTLAATGSETNLVAAGIGGALLLAGAMALVLTARRRQVSAE